MDFLHTTNLYVPRTFGVVSLLKNKAVCGAVRLYAFGRAFVGYLQGPVQFLQRGREHLAEGEEASAELSPAPSVASK